MSELVLRAGGFGLMSSSLMDQPRFSRRLAYPANDVLPRALEDSVDARTLRLKSMLEE